MSPGTPKDSPIYVRYRYFIAFCVAMLCVLGGGVYLGTQVDNTQSDQAAIEREQKRGQVRDKLLRGALERIQSSREESVRVVCRLNNQQNAVLLSIIDFSVKASKQRPEPGLTEAERRQQLEAFVKLLRPITPRHTKKVCDALLVGVRSTVKPSSTPSPTPTSTP